jgi:cobalt-zinc-cadmium efflux system outer membrane protein
VKHGIGVVEQWKRWKQWAAVALLTLSCLRGMPVSAQAGSSPLPDRVTLDDVLRLLEQRSPRTAADRASIPVVAADRITAQTLPNPTFSYGGVHLVSGLSTGAVTQHQMVVEQPLLLFHQRQARLDAATGNVTAEEARVAETLAGRRLAVRQAFASLLSRQEQLRVVQESLTNLERVAQLVRARAAAGDRSQYEVLRIETETESFRVQMMNAAADVEDVSGQLAALLGLPGWSPRASGVLDVGVVSTDVEVLWASAERRRPSLVALRQQEAAARGGLFLARRERLPVPVVSGGAQRTQDVTGTSAFFGLSIPLTLFDHNQGAVAKATAQIDAADLSIRAGLGEARAEIERAATVLKKRREALQSLEAAVMGRIPTLRRMAEDAYREGSADILELLDANRSLRDFQLARVQQLEAVRLAEETVVGAAGLDATEPVQ